MVLKRVKYVGRYPEVELQNPAGDWVTVKKGGHIDVPTRMANEMATQEDNWEIVEAPKKEAEEKPTPVADKKDGD